MKKISLLLVFTISIFACDKNKSFDKMNSVSQDIKAMETSVVYSKRVSQNDADYKPKIIKTSRLEFETSSVEKTYQKIRQSVAKNNGFIQNDRVSNDYGRIVRTLIVRIPSQNFQTLIDTIQNNVTVFDTKEISLKDVTEEFVDLEARLKAKKALEARYIQLLAKAKNVKEMLQIEREIANLREEIEAKQGRLKYLNNKVSLSTINLSFYEITKEIKTKSNSFFNRFGKAIKGGFNNLGEFIIGIIYIWPFVIVMLILAYFIRKWFKKRHK